MAHLVGCTLNAGFYTQAELRELESLARQHHIQLVPEIDLPGHADALIASYPRMGTLTQPIQVQQTGRHEVLNLEESTFEVRQI